MQFVLSDQNDKCLLEKERVRIKSLKNLCEQLFSKYFPQISGSQEDNQISIFGCPHSFFGRRGHAKFATLPLQIPSANYICSDYHH